MSSEPYRSDSVSLRDRFVEAERGRAAAERRIGELEAEVSIATGMAPRAARVRHLAVAVVVAATVGSFAGYLARRSESELLERRLLAIQQADVSIGRERDDFRCSLRFLRTRETTDLSGRVTPVCHTTIRCEETLYDGLTDCHQAQYLRDESTTDGDGTVLIDLLAGTAVVEGEQFRF